VARSFIDGTRDTDGADVAPACPDGVYLSADLACSLRAFFSPAALLSPPPAASASTDCPVTALATPAAPALEVRGLLDHLSVLLSSPLPDHRMLACALACLFTPLPSNRHRLETEDAEAAGATATGGAPDGGDMTTPARPRTGGIVLSVDEASRRMAKGTPAGGKAAPHGRKAARAESTRSVGDGVEAKGDRQVPQGGRNDDPCEVRFASPVFSSFPTFSPLYSVLSWEPFFLCTLRARVAEERV